MGMRRPGIVDNLVVKPAPSPLGEEKPYPIERSIPLDTTYTINL